MLAIQAMEASLSSQLSQLNSGIDRVISTIQASSPTASTSSMNSINWTPIVQALVSGVGTALGASVSFSSQAKSQVEVPLAQSSPLESSTTLPSSV
jgi:hypothetical protein